MLNFIKKHFNCFSVFILLLIIAFARYFERKDKYHDWRFFPLAELNIPSQTTIKYRTGIYDAPSCIQLAFKSEEVIQHFDSHLIFDNPQHHSKSMVNSQTEGKPHFTIKIYQGLNLLDTKEMYMTRVVSLSRHEIDNKLIDLSFLQGFWNLPRHEIDNKLTKPSHLQRFSDSIPACYNLEPNSNYTIEIINDTPLAKFQGMAAFLVIRPNTSQW